MYYPILKKMSLRLRALLGFQPHFDQPKGRASTPSISPPPNRLHSCPACLAGDHEGACGRGPGTSGGEIAGEWRGLQRAAVSCVWNCLEVVPQGFSRESPRAPTVTSSHGRKEHHMLFIEVFYICPIWVLYIQCSQHLRMKTKQAQRRGGNCRGHKVWSEGELNSSQAASHWPWALFLSIKH